MQIVPANSPTEIETIRGLFREYAASLPIKLDYQGFETELATLPGKYAPPRGRLLLAVDTDGKTAGCVAVRPFDAGRCEMKRLYLRSAYQGRGLGRLLAQRAIEEARAGGYAGMLLDTLGSMHAAIGLYEQLGFLRRTAYYDTPVANTVFMELKLAQ
jgi:ribosomal protein S18 acetylase RimI-like enzyme